MPSDGGEVMNIYGCMNVGVAGLGSIATKISRTINAYKGDDIALYACASRSAQKAEAFADKYGFCKSYGDYQSLFYDENVDIVYVATPHSTHFDVAKAAITAGKNVIVEKPACTDAAKFRALCDLAKDRGVFLTEAFWTAFDPLVLSIRSRIKSGEFGAIRSIRSSFCQPLRHVKRMTDPALAGGALLDLGIYCAFHTFFYHDMSATTVTATATKYKTGVDLTTDVKVCFDGFESSFRCSFAGFGKNDVTVETERATINLNSVNFPTKVTIKDSSTGKKTVEKLKRITGYEYEFIAAKKYIAAGATETEEIPHEFSIKQLSLCDEVRKIIGVTYPFD